MPRAIVYTEFGSPDVLRLSDIDPASPAAGEVAIRVEAAGVNPIDAKLRAGIRPSGPIQTPRRVGADGAGVITAVGDGVEGLRAGEPVVFFGAGGAYADEITLTADRVVPRPPSVSAEDGAGVGIPAGTAYQALRSLAVGAGDTLLLHGGSGAVGQAAIQFAVLWGARVIATCSPARAERVAALGAEPVAYGAGLADRVRALAPGGVTVALDTAGTDEALEVSRDLVTDPARAATIVRGRDAAGYGLRAFGGGSPEPLSERALAWRVEAVPVTLALLAAGGFSIEHGPSLPLSAAAEAHRLVEAGTAGKITLLPA